MTIQLNEVDIRMRVDAGARDEPPAEEPQPARPRLGEEEREDIVQETLGRVLDALRAAGER